jgi:hypothetical protein
MRTKFERTAQPRVSREIYTQQNPEEDFAKPTQPERSEGNAQRSKAQCRASRQSNILSFRRRKLAHQHSLSKAEATHNEAKRSAVHHGNPSYQESGGGFLQISID